MELMGNEAVKQGVEAGLGFAVVSSPHGRAGVNAKPAGTLHVHGLPIMRRWYVAHRRGKAS